MWYAASDASTRYVCRQDALCPPDVSRQAYSEDQTTGQRRLFIARDALFGQEQH